MKPATNTKIARALSKLGYRWGGLRKEQQKRGVVIICATASPKYDDSAVPVTVASTTEKAALDGLLAAVKAVRP